MYNPFTEGLFVYLELGVTILEEGIDLLGSSNTSVDVGLGSLGTHLLRSREVTTFELLELVVGIRHDVGDELQVLALLHQFDELRLVDVEVRDKHTKELQSFDLSNLRWSKVVICTDADVDGYHIRTLILTMLYRLVPTLIREGYVYIAESPLYEINSKGKTWFAYSEKEKAEIVESLKGAKATISRSKGLGENDPDMMWMTTMNPETRRLIKVMPEDAERMAQVFDLLLGDDLEGRKNHISEFGAQYLDLADLS